jgi:hypothetical protein
LSASYIANHLAKFNEGVSCLKLKRRNFDPFETIGKDELFVLPKSEMDALLAKTNGDISLIEKELGIDVGDWANEINKPINPDELIRIDISSWENLRMANGTETSANKLWLPGGKTPEGWSEAVINVVSKGDVSKYTTTKVILR